jgi:hypothetical protein
MLDGSLAPTIMAGVQEPAAIKVRRHLSWSITGLEEGLSTQEGDRHNIGTALRVKFRMSFQNTRRSGHCVGTHPYMKDEFYWVYVGKIIHLKLVYAPQNLREEAPAEKGLGIWGPQCL